MLDAQEVVAVLEHAFMRIESPAAHAASLGDDDAGRAQFGHGDVGGHGVRLVLGGDDAGLADPHAREQQLAISADQPWMWTPRKSGSKRSILRSSSGTTLYFTASMSHRRCMSASFWGFSVARLWAWVQSSGQ